eukprot:3755813-Prymnesium_polylepis.2
MAESCAVRIQSAHSVRTFVVRGLSSQIARHNSQPFKSYACARVSKVNNHVRITHATSRRI